MIKRDTIGPIGVPGERFSSGIGFIIVPEDQERDVFIKRCYLTGTVSIKVDNEPFPAHNVKIDKMALQEIEFPANHTLLGSMICWVNYPQHNAPIVVALLKKSDELSSHRENTFNHTRSSQNGGLVSIKGDGKGKLFVSVDSSDLEDVSEINVSLTSKEKDSKFNILTQGEFNLNTVGKTTFKATEEMNIEISDPSSEDKTEIKYTKEQVQVKSKKIINGEGKEPITLGNACKEVFDAFIDEVSKSTVTTLIGTQPLLNAVQIAALKQQTEKILSKLSFTD